MDRLAFPFRAWSLSHRELLRGYVMGALGQLPVSHWTQDFSFDPEGRWELDGDLQPLEELWSFLFRNLSSYVTDALKLYRLSASDRRPEYDLSGRVAKALVEGAQRWATEAIWAVRFGPSEGIPAYPGLFRLPDAYTAHQPPDPGQLEEQLQSALRRLYEGGGSIARSCLVFLIRTINWSLDPGPELAGQLEKVRQWCMTYQSPQAEADQLRGELRALTNDAVLLKAMLLLEPSSDGVRAADLTVEVSRELGRREFARLTADLRYTHSSAEESGRFWADAARYELLSTTYLRLQPED